MGDRMTICRKIQIVPTCKTKGEFNEMYTFLREAMKNQNQAYNILMSNMYSQKMIDNNVKLNDILKIGSRVKDSKAGVSLYDEIDINVSGYSTAETQQHAKNDFSKSLKDGLMYGRVRLPHKKLDAPLWVSSAKLKFSHDYKNHNDFLDDLSTRNFTVNLSVFNTRKFNIVFGNPKKSEELRSVIRNIFEENYKVQGSSIQINDTKIILNLSISIPKKVRTLDEDTVVGVDLGVAIPAMCALNNDKYSRLKIGSVDDFYRVRTKIQMQHRQLQRHLKTSTGGKGRKRKLKPLDRFTKYETNFVQTYNHMVSKNVVDFALKHNAKYINLEDLSGYDGNDIILRNWSYYQMQQYITYKSELYGIIVRKINPAYTSQKCSECGHVDSDNRPKGEKGQGYFKCTKCGHETNADFNGARNIAISKEFVE